MKILYLDCGMGVAGDMLMAALLELCPDKPDFLQRLNAMLDGRAVVSAKPDKKCGICGTHVTVLADGVEEGTAHEHEHHHAHTSITDIYTLLDGIQPQCRAVRDAKKVYALLAEAESCVHGEAVENIHFHEVGSIDALADILGVCMLINELALDIIIASPVHVGSGTVRCAHGVLPVPAPATEYLLRGIPIYGGNINAELCTPTGAALIKYFCDDFGALPQMRVSAVGVGTGKKDFERANAVRAMLGETDGGTDDIFELKCNLDDMTPEAIGFAQERLFALGALDVYTLSAGMKKNRPGSILCVMYKEKDRDNVLHGVFKYTTTIGVREYRCSRHVLKRYIEEVNTPYGAVRVKYAEGYGVTRRKAEFDDVAKIARENGLTLDDVEKSIEEH